MEADSSWKRTIYSRLRDRNKKEAGVYRELIDQLTSVLEKCESYRLENAQLTLQHHQSCGAAAASGTEKQTAYIQELEGKLYRLGEEVTQLHRGKSDTADQLVTLTQLHQNRDKETLAMRNTVTDLESQVMLLNEELEAKRKSNKELTDDNNLIRDEYRSLNLAYDSLEKEFTKIKVENCDLVERWIQYKALDAERLNEENDKHFQSKQRDTAAKLDEAAKDFKLVVLPAEPDPCDIALGTVACPYSVVPKHCYFSQETHSADLHTLRISNSGRLLATGGEDRKLKLWSLSRNGFSSYHTLLGCNAGINAIEFSPDDTLVMAASTDQACRIWAVQEQRIRHALTGHSGKVTCCKFVADVTKVVTGSHDRTIKVWDLMSKACSRTIFVGSSCNDLVLAKSSAAVVFSGHHDRKLRVYDLRTNSEASAEIATVDKVTSVSLLNNGYQCLVSCRDNLLRVIDVRQKHIVTELGGAGVGLGSDLARACVSPDDSYCAVGSTDGTIHVWDLATGELAMQEPLTSTHTSCVMAVSWTPDGCTFASCERSRNTALWTV